MDDGLRYDRGARDRAGRAGTGWAQSRIGAAAPARWRRPELSGRIIVLAIPETTVILGFLGPDPPGAVSRRTAIRMASR
jgi:hypothetical protein